MPIGEIQLCTPRLQIPTYRPIIQRGGQAGPAIGAVAPILRSERASVNDCRYKPAARGAASGLARETAFIG